MMKKNYVLDFNQIRKENISIAGGKGANLGEMISNSIPVPRGFILTTDAYKNFLEVNKLEEIFSQRISESSNGEGLFRVGEELRTQIRSGFIPNDIKEEIREYYEALGTDVRVAVRSSATAEDLADASFAGQQETYLNVQGIEDIYQKIIECYASLWGDRAIAYRNNQNYDNSSVALAVVIQEMIESEKAGVLFTVDPVGQNPDHMQINASYGLGESVVSGRVTADTIICNKSNQIISSSIGSKKTKIIYGKKNTVEVPVSSEQQKKLCLNKNEIEKLCTEARRIELHYGKPMDIEWAIKDDTIYILQARAITTLNIALASEEKIIQEYLKNSHISGIAKTNMAFQLEKMPFAYRPLDYDINMHINHQKEKLFSEAGINMSSDPQIDDDGIMTLPSPHKSLNKNILKLPKTLKLFKDFDYCELQLKENMPKLQQEIDNLTEKNYNSFSITECGDFLEYAYELIGRICYLRFKYSLFPSFICRDFNKALKKINKNYTNYELCSQLDNKTALVARDISVLAQKLKKDSNLITDMINGMNYSEICLKYPNYVSDFEYYLKKHGFKSDFNCYCCISKTLNENPDRLLNILRPLCCIDNDISQEINHINFKELMSKLKDYYGSKYPKYEKKINSYRYFFIVREDTQYMWETVFYYIRKVLSKTNQLLLGTNDHISGIDNLYLSELLAACKKGKLSDKDKEIILRRNSKHSLSQKVWDASKLLVFDNDGETLKGVSGSSGQAVGKVCIVHGPKEFCKMKKGDILVCPMTDPEWTPLFKLAAGVVADTGAALSHAAIVAREYGIPAVMGVGFATTNFKDMDTIKVDGTKGIVTKIS
jgi:pyruvate,water dikinase